ncbi:PREDICTED: uncharacterized protein LOC109221313 [Nicotiana attenuata]|uniref:uncharacterized protein LOC109221313 n=1 Tax=Nicotiana attenuata TaxID=49451 RepID=UPI000904EF8D|nr:PREDICTED: uncharacterized protein LOC109221313 [Nicotiana attenuata]
MIKIDLQKAYDSVEWPFLRQMLTELGFPEQFIIWVMEYVQTVNYTVMINGEPSEPFNADRGLRQGDLMSPFLFAIAMEYLSRKLNELKADRSFQFHPKCAKLGITHLSFADDLLLFAKGNLSSITALHKCFSQFSEASGLQANLGKSCVYFGGVKGEIQDSILSHLGFVHGTLPFKYMGVPLSTKKITLLQWQPLIEKFTARVTSWTAKKLSYAYWAQLFLIPAKVLKTIDAYCRSYVWSGSNTITRKALVAWDRDKMWIRWIHAYYVQGKLLRDMPIPAQASWITRKILEAKEHLHLIPINDARPKAVFTMWLQLQGRLATTDRLVKWGLAVDTTCILCQNQLETKDHLFAECEFTKAIWRKMQQWLQWLPAMTWNQHTKWAIQKAKGESQQAQIFRMVYAECIYAIWMERNHRIFEKKYRNWEAIAREVTYICHVRAAPRVKILLQSFVF